MEFTDRHVGHQESSPITPICSCFRGNSNTSQIHHLTYMKEAIEREIEKDKIRQEIIASETGRRTRRLLLEAEVRRELMMELEYSNRGLSFMRPAAHSAGVMPEDTTLEEKIAMVIYGGKQLETLPFQGGTEDSREARTEKKKIILVGQPPEENISGSKRKAETQQPPRADISSEVLFGNMTVNTKKHKEDWSCGICRVNSTSKLALDDHVRGRKHKAKEAALRAGKIITTVDACAKKKDETKSTTENSVVQKTYTRRYRFWCDVCKWGTYSMKFYSKHAKGKRHIGKTGESLLTTINEFENLVDPENKEPMEDIMTEGGNVGWTADDEPGNPVKLGNDELVDVKESDDHKLVEDVTSKDNNNVDKFVKPGNGELEYVDPVTPENGKLVDKAGVEYEKNTSEGEKISTEGSGLDENIISEFLDMKESEDQKLVEDLTSKGYNDVDQLVKPENGELEHVNPVTPENGKLVDKAGVQYEKIFIISDGKEISTEGSVLAEIMIGEFMNEGEIMEPENDDKVMEVEEDEDWASYITDPENRLTKDSGCSRTMSDSY